MSTIDKIRRNLEKRKNARALKNAKREENQVKRSTGEVLIDTVKDQSYMAGYVAGATETLNSVNEKTKESKPIDSKIVKQIFNVK